MNSYNKLVTAILGTASVIGIAFAIAMSIIVWLSEWKDLPGTVGTLETSIQQLTTTVNTLINDRDLFMIDILGDEVVTITEEIYAGEIIWITMFSRANVSCDREIVVRFYHDENRAYYPESRNIQGVKPVVSNQHQLLTVPIMTFSGMEPGTYRYAAEIKPIDCGVYNDQLIPFSNSFRVVERPDNDE